MSLSQAYTETIRSQTARALYSINFNRYVHTLSSREITLNSRNFMRSIVKVIPCIYNIVHLSNLYLIV